MIFKRTLTAMPDVSKSVSLRIFLNGPFLGLFFFSSFRQTVNSKLFNKIWLWLNSNPGTRVSEVTALSTVPQHWWPDNGLKSSSNFSKLHFWLNKWCFKNTPKVTKHLGYFWKMICHYGLSKIAQSGSTGHTTNDFQKVVRGILVNIANRITMPHHLTSHMGKPPFFFTLINFEHWNMID